MQSQSCWLISIICSSMFRLRTCWLMSDLRSKQNNVVDDTFNDDDDEEGGDNMKEADS